MITVITGLCWDEDVQLSARNESELFRLYRLGQDLRLCWVPENADRADKSATNKKDIIDIPAGEAGETKQ